MAKRPPKSVEALAEFGRIRLSDTFFVRDFLFSDIAAVHGLLNVPDDIDLFVAAGSKLCQELLEPLQNKFGRIAVRSAYRSPEVNGLGNAQQRAGKAGYNCANNESNFAGHIWDKRDAAGNMGATACIIIPAFWDKHNGEGDWQKLAWWIHDNLPYDDQYYFPKFSAFNLTWRENPRKIITSYVTPRGTLTKPGMSNHSCDHSQYWKDI